MPRQAKSEPISTSTAKVAEIDALASAMDRSCNYIANQTIEQYLEVNTWQIKRIRDGIVAAREGQTLPADQVFAGIAARHGCSR